MKGAFALALLFSVGACGVGGVDDMNGEGEEDDVPSVLVCQAELTVTGSLTPSGAVPGPEDGCMPEGTWTLALSMADPGECDAVPFDQEYAYRVVADEQSGFLTTYLGDTSGGQVALKVTGAGGGCEGNFEHYSGDGYELLLLKPFTEGTTITGRAYYEQYSQAQI